MMEIMDRGCSGGAGVKDVSLIRGGAGVQASAFCGGGVQASAF